MAKKPKPYKRTPEGGRVVECVACTGTGEGWIDGQRCNACWGDGYVVVWWTGDHCTVERMPK